MSLRSVALYLPQFHPIPENDAWWGPGFTEWTNVAKARPLFPGHHQPQLPGDLGFYDLRVPEVRVEQAAMAAEYGVSGFCYYHYWFNGRRLLERPFAEVLASGEPDFPFCLAWANENWTRRWDGAEHEILLGQDYTLEDDLAHIRSLREAFTDPRYITVEGKPVFLVYRSRSLPDPLATTNLWREEAASWGLPGLHLVRFRNEAEDVDPAASGFDATLRFQPQYWNLPPAPLWQRVGNRLTFGRGIFGHEVRPYRKVVEHALAEAPSAYPSWPCVTPAWDNTARKKRYGIVFTGSTPARFEAWLRETVQRARRVDDNGLVFVNAWNEWAEGNHLEPDRRFGRAYLEAHRRAVSEQ